MVLLVEEGVLFFEGAGELGGEVGGAALGDGGGVLELGDVVFFRGELGEGRGEARLEVLVVGRELRHDDAFVAEARLR